MSKIERKQIKLQKKQEKKKLKLKKKQRKKINRKLNGVLTTIAILICLASLAIEAVGELSKKAEASS